MDDDDFLFAYYYQELILGGYQPPPLQQAPPQPHSHQQYVQEYDPSGFYPHHQQPPPRQQQQQQQQHPHAHHQGPSSPLVQTRTHHPQAPAPAPQYPDSSSVAGGGPPYAVEYAPAPPPLQHSEYIPAPPSPEHAGGQTADGEALDEEPLYVNAKQYHRVLKRRAALLRLEEARRLNLPRKPYRYESRHNEAMCRPRGPSGRFLSAAEIAAGLGGVVAQPQNNNENAHHDEENVERTSPTHEPALHPSAESESAPSPDIDLRGTSSIETPIPLQTDNRNPGESQGGRGRWAHHSRGVGRSIRPRS